MPTTHPKQLSAVSDRQVRDQMLKALTEALDMDENTKYDRAPNADDLSRAIMTIATKIVKYGFYTRGNLLRMASAFGAAEEHVLEDSTKHSNRRYKYRKN